MGAVRAQAGRLGYPGGRAPHHRSRAGWKEQKHGLTGTLQHLFHVCPWQEPELPLDLCAMGEMEQLRQEAEQLKKQIAVTPEPSS